jgi:hypothetical protein
MKHTNKEPQSTSTYLQMPCLWDTKPASQSSEAQFAFRGQSATSIHYHLQLALRINSHRIWNLAPQGLVALGQPGAATGVPVGTHGHPPSPHGGSWLPSAAAQGRATACRWALAGPPCRGPTNPVDVRGVGSPPPNGVADFTFEVAILPPQILF